MKTAEIKVVRMPNGKYLVRSLGGMTQKDEIKYATKWYGEEDEVNVEEFAHDWGGTVVILREKAR